MERSWLEKFYTECGREVSLAYNVLNHTNNWGVTIVTVFLAGIIISAFEVKEGIPTLYYPTKIHWFLVVGAWIALLRFFVRSALGLTNMYRWNELIHASSKVLSLPEDSPSLPVYLRNCAKKIDAYYYRFRSPVSRWKIIWHNLKLMYLWFFVAVLALFVWGLLVIGHDWQYYLGIGLFISSVVLECCWFVKWHGLQYEKLDLEKEPSILQIWLAGAVDSGVWARPHMIRVPQVRESRILQYLGTIAKAATLVSLVGMVGLFVWRWHAGSQVPALVTIASNVFSIAFLGSLISFGGVNLLSLHAKSEATLEQLGKLAQNCPFSAIIKDSSDEVHRPGSPEFCVKCPLGIDIVSDQQRGYLINNCLLYDSMHANWRLLPQAKRRISERWGFK